MRLFSCISIGGRAIAGRLSRRIVEQCVPRKRRRRARSSRPRAAFAGQYDGRAVVDNTQYASVRKLFDTEKPDVVFVQWPVDIHRDHRALSSLVLDAWLQSGKTSTLYYYGIAEDTMMFNASEFVDITDVEVRKRAACYAHESQDPRRWYPLQEQITRAHGLESGYADAEGFIRHWQSREDRLP